MSFASAWLDQRALYQQFIIEPPVTGTGIIVVVPAYNEPGITVMLDSLASAAEPDCEAEVILTINAPPGAPEEFIKNNLLAVKAIGKWKEDHKDCFFSLFCIEPVSVHGWGVGMARKAGMDEALRRFDSIEKPDGIIVCLDADCTVEAGYFRSIEKGFEAGKNRQACSIYFEHDLSGSQLPEKTIKAITLYELHLRYYFQALIYSGFPDVFHTVGSAMAVRAMPYMKCGGMNRKQAGEDFYFIQKLLASGGYFSINSTIVYPSARSSFRVPFGTGAAMEKLLDEDDPSYLTYDLRAFTGLKDLFENLDKHYKDDSYNELSPALKIFINEDEWLDKLNEIKANTSGLASFRKRFFAWFNMFKIVKYLNSVHQGYFSKKHVEESAQELLEKLGGKAGIHNTTDLLMIYRSLEKS